MTIQITRPEIEELIEQRLHSGAFKSVEDVLIDALEVQREREAWLLENKDLINEKIERGCAQLDRGEGMPGDQVWARLEADRAAWLAEHAEEVAAKIATGFAQAESGELMDGETAVEMLRQRRAERLKTSG
jgi:antitoxin ParD1/3/4